MSMIIYIMVKVTDKFLEDDHVKFFNTSKNNLKFDNFAIHIYS